MTVCSYCSLTGEYCTSENGVLCQKKLQVLKERIDASDYNDRSEVGPVSGNSANLNASLPLPTSGSTLLDPVHRFFSTVARRRRRRNSEVSNSHEAWTFSREKSTEIEPSGEQRDCNTTPGSESSLASNNPGRESCSDERRNLDVDFRSLKLQMSGKYFPKNARRESKKCDEFRQRCVSFLSHSIGQSGYGHVENINNTNQTAGETRIIRAIRDLVGTELDKKNLHRKSQGEESSSRNEPASSARDMGNLQDNEQINVPETLLSHVKPIERSSVVMDEDDIRIFKCMYNDVDKAIHLFDQKALRGQNGFLSLFKTEPMESEASVLEKFVEMRKMVEQGLVSTCSLVPKVDCEGSQAIYTSSIRPSPRSLPISPNAAYRSPERCSFGTTRGGQRCSPVRANYSTLDSRRTPNVHLPTLSSTLQRFKGRSVSTIDETEENPSLLAMPVGMFNRDGKVCFVNASLQLLSAVPEMLDLVRKGIHFQEKRGNMDLKACNAYKTYMEKRKRAMANPRRCPISSLNVARVMFHKYPRIFKAGEQHDCEEFLTKLLEVIHRELGEKFSPRKLFGGSQRTFSTPELLSTGRTMDASNSQNVKLDEFTTVFLHFTEQHSDIEDCFHTYTSEQRSSDTNAFHWCKFEVLPRWLLVYVQSYVQSERLPQKMHRKVRLVEKLQFRDEWMYEAEQVPLDGSCGVANSDDCVESASGSRDTGEIRLYLLRGVVFHAGHDTISGHYTTAVASTGSRVWYLCNDEEVGETTLPELDGIAETDQVTLMLYERMC